MAQEFAKGSGTRIRFCAWFWVPANAGRYDLGRQWRLDGTGGYLYIVMSSLMISLLRKVIPNEVRIATFIVVIATFVTVADRTIAAFIRNQQGAWSVIPLIVVNCIVLARQEAFASKNPVGRSVIDALGMSVGFTLVLLVMGSFRELIGNGTVFAHQIMPLSFQPWMAIALQPGAFLTLGS
jgi:electron transport complex protein RnfE